MPAYNANKEWLKAHGLNGRDANRLVTALCTLADYEGVIKRKVLEVGGRYGSHTEVCSAIRAIVDGKELANEL